MKRTTNRWVLLTVGLSLAACDADEVDLEEGGVDLDDDSDDDDSDDDDSEGDSDGDDSEDDDNDADDDDSDDDDSDDDSETDDSDDDDETESSDAGAVDGGASEASESGSDAGADAGIEAPPSRDWRGGLVVNGDYVSISVSVVDTEAEVLSEVLISSGSMAPELNLALSGDVVLPASATFGDEAVLIDRSNAVLTWVELGTAEVRAQLDVGPGFDSNPHDYLQIAEDKAYVARFAENGDPGQEDFDSGSDLLVIDPSIPEMVGSIDLTGIVEEGFPPGPEQMVYAGGQVHVLLVGLAPDFSDIATARLVSIDPELDEVTQTLTFDGMRNCGSLAVSPNGEQVAVGCTGFFRQDPADGWPDAGVVVLSVGSNLEEVTRFDSSLFQYCVDDACQNTQLSGLTWISDEYLAASTFGASFGGPNMDVNYPAMLVQLDVEAAEATTLLEAGAFDLGRPRCFDDACLVTDAANGLYRFEIGDDGLSESTLHSVDQTIGLPPRSLQRF